MLLHGNKYDTVPEGPKLLSAGLLRAPQPAERIGEDRAAVLVVVAARASDELDVVLREPQRGVHLLVGQPPVPVLVVQVLLSVLQKHAQRLPRRLPDERRIDVAAPDVREAADVAEHLAK